MKKISRHGKERIEERLGLDFNNKILFKNALMYGFSKENFSEDLYMFLYNKTLKGAKIKVYKDFIFVISKNKKKLITTYPIPKCFLPLENFFINTGKSKLLYFTEEFINKEVVLELNNNMKIHGTLKYFYGKYFAEKIVIKCQDNQYYIINSNIIDNIYINMNAITEELFKEFCF